MSPAFLKLKPIIEANEMILDNLIHIDTPNFR